MKKEKTDWVKIIAIVLAVMFFYLWMLSPDSSIDLDSKTQFLTDQNYEVLNYGYNELAKESPNYDPDATIRDFAFVEMKGFGSRDEQVKDGFIFLGTEYEEASEYNVVVFTESERCSYRIDGEIYRAHIHGLSNYWSDENPILMNKSDIEGKLDYIIWSGFLKSELEKLENGEETEKDYGLYEIGIMMKERDKLDNSGVDRDTIWQIYNYHQSQGYCE